MFPQTLGIYLYERSGKIVVSALAKSSIGAPSATGQITVTLNDERVQLAPVVLFLHPCSGPATDNLSLCDMSSSPPDGGDAGGDAEAGIDANASIDTNAGADAAPFDAGLIPPECTQYCTGLMSACPALFPGQGKCEASCAAAQLTPAEFSCLLDRTTLALSDPATCIDASLISADCSEPCHVYCALGSSVCGAPFFSSDCITLCQPLSQNALGNPDSPRGDDSLLCRVSWLEEATADPSRCSRAVLAGSCQAQ